APQLFDLDLPQLFGLLLGSFNRNARAVGTEELIVSFVVSSLNAPVYLSFPVKDAKVVDEFLEALDQVLPALARQGEDIGRVRFEQDFYRARLKAGPVMRSYG